MYTEIAGVSSLTRRGRPRRLGGGTAVTGKGGKGGGGGEGHGSREGYRR